MMGLRRDCRCAHRCTAPATHSVPVLAHKNVASGNLAAGLSTVSMHLIFPIVSAASCAVPIASVAMPTERYAICAEHVRMQAKKLFLFCVLLSQQSSSKGGQTPAPVQWQPADKEECLPFWLQSQQSIASVLLSLWRRLAVERCSAPSFLPSRARADPPWPPHALRRVAPLGKTWLRFRRSAQLTCT